MGKVKEQKLKEIELCLLALFALLNMDKPMNFDQIVDYIFNDMAESADGENWSDGDVVTGFRRWIEGQFRDDSNYFQILNQGYNKSLEREEIQIHGGENANIFLIKTNEGFIVDVYGQNDHVGTLTVWEDDLNPVEEESGAPENFSDVEIQEFKENWGQSHGEITSELGFPRSHAEADELILDTGNYFWIEADKKWYNKCASLFTEREQAIANYLRASN
jgi:hypothetical protein